jgi:Zn-dependent protease with chaperone function
MNAFALPSKDVFVYTGLLDVLPDDNAMLAAVLAHEIAHVVERHSVENLGVSACIHVRLVWLISVPQCRCCCV